MSNATKRLAGLRAGRPSDGKKATTLSSMADKRQTVRVNFDLERETHTRLKVDAAQTGRTISEIMVELVEAYLSK
jgi:macrodomain Ter protein organizer (MatP/YcbG family)